MAKINKIDNIKQYKSFYDFSWSELCKNKDGHESFLQKFNIIFGENGAGKSSICDIFKSISQIQDFQKKPTLAEVTIDDQMYKFEDGRWSPTILQKNSFLFFDVDFINENIHTHGERSNIKDKHAQKAGKIIIDLDAKANNLKNIIDIKKIEIEDFEKTHKILKQSFSEKDKELYESHKDLGDTDKGTKVSTLQEQLKILESDLSSLQLLDKKHSDINHLSLINKISLTTSLEEKGKYIELFNRQIKEKSQDGADEKVKSHFEKHKFFIESAKNHISEDFSNEDCPLCMQPLKNAANVITYYRAVFDHTYNAEKEKLLSDIQERKNEIELLKEDLLSLPSKVTTIFDSIEKIKTDFLIQNLYKLNDKIEYTSKFKNIEITELSSILASLESLKNINRTQINIEDAYVKITEKIQNIQNNIDSLNAFITEKNQAITEFKNKYSDQEKLKAEIHEKNKKYIHEKELMNFLTGDKVKLLKEKDDCTAKQAVMSEELKNIRKELQTYLAESIPESVINQMITILEKFNLSFTLEHIKPAPNTKDYSFSFIIKDINGTEREFKNGLSEGERQLISIAFFFATNENLPNKTETVLIFDDPITSLDSPKLKILSDLICEKKDAFLQTIVFTHHPLFFKYLKKHGNSKQLGILKNHEKFGGSFIYDDPGFDLITEVQQCNEEIKTNAINGKLNPEEIALKYGQLLRLAIERFIKNDLLMWNKEKAFEDITENLKQGKSKMANISDDDLDTIKNIYKYCNYSNLLHADKENPSALSELITHIEKFTQILKKSA